MKIVILTGNEIRHKFFRIKVAQDKRINVLSSFCEGTEQSLKQRTESNPLASKIELMHVDARTRSEHDFFETSIDLLEDLSNPKFISKGSVNDKKIVDEIKSLKPDILVCYGSSLIRSDLLNFFKKKFLNVHLGLSPYYRGSGTNIWPLINLEPDMVGATFMYIDEGIDTGEIIHQIRADIYLGDSAHTIGNRLIIKMTRVYCDIISRFENLTDEIQPNKDGKLYFKKDFNELSCERLYDNFSNDMVRNFLENTNSKNLPYIVKNKGFN